MALSKPMADLTSVQVQAQKKTVFEIFAQNHFGNLFYTGNTYFDN